MAGWELASIWWLSLMYYALAVLSAVLPWVNAEVLMLSALPLARAQSHDLAILVLVVTAGQMTGKSVMYWLSRSATGERSPRVQAALDKWRVRFERCPQSALAVVFVSSTIGFPPFYIVSVVAGALRVAYGRFLTVGGCGRLLHFAIVALLPQLVWRKP